jgi:hypothetical protein
MVLSKKLPSFHLFDGLIGLGINPPSQFGQTHSRTFSTEGGKASDRTLSIVTIFPNVLD